MKWRVLAGRFEFSRFFNSSHLTKIKIENCASKPQIKRGAAQGINLFVPWGHITRNKIMTVQPVSEKSDQLWQVVGFTGKQSKMKSHMIDIKLFLTSHQRQRYMGCKWGKRCWKGELLERSRNDSVRRELDELARIRLPELKDIQLTGCKSCEYYLTTLF